jgi:hypothetical protein
MALMSGNTLIFDGSVIAVPTTNEVVFNNSITFLTLDYRTDGLTPSDMNITVTANYTFTTPVNGLALPNSVQTIVPTQGPNRIIQLNWSYPVQKVIFEASSASGKKLYLSVLEMHGN